MVILLFGPPGSGKGTQARLILEWFKPRIIPSISTGDMLRGEIAAGTPLGMKTKEIIAAGGLVSDDLINEILCSRISRPDCQDGFLLDGYPRTVEQADFLDKVLSSRGLPPPVVIHLDVPSHVLIGRMISRRQCPKCNRMFNILTDRPKVPGRCDDCDTPLIVRKDDQEDVIRERIKTYKEVTRAVLGHYASAQLHQISGDRSANYIFEEITKVLENVMQGERFQGGGI